MFILLNISRHRCREFHIAMSSKKLKKKIYLIVYTRMYNHIKLVIYFDRKNYIGIVNILPW